MTFTGKGQWLWRFIQESDKSDVRDISNEAAGKDDYVSLLIDKWLGHKNFYALGVEVDKRLVRVKHL